MNILSWNYRGASSKKVLRNVQSLLSYLKPDMLILLETRVPSSRAIRVSLARFLISLHAVNPRGLLGVFGSSGGVMWFLWMFCL